ncbi:hypothetical protein QE152_g4561 [Popillia japonica]|uniref:Uncharacterized protein n=1 Tax=Popillia japonica TaxID=7064 RepID=A0AAW1N060_POPJA
MLSRQAFESMKSVDSNKGDLDSLDTVRVAPQPLASSAIPIGSVAAPNSPLMSFSPSLLCPSTPYTTKLVSTVDEVATTGMATFASVGEANLVVPDVEVPSVVNKTPISRGSRGEYQRLSCDDKHADQDSRRLYEQQKRDKKQEKKEQRRGHKQEKKERYQRPEKKNDTKDQKKKNVPKDRNKDLKQKNKNDKYRNK